MTRIILKQNWTSIPISLIFIIIICLIFAGYYFTPRISQLTRLNWKSSVSSLDDISINTTESSNNLTTSSRTLIVYVYGKSHALAEQNLAFFIRTAVRQSHHADYYFILQQIDNKIFDETKLPILPSNAHYVQHENKCFDIGTIGWFLSIGMIDKNRYKYFIFLNSSVRGPFIVSYYDSPVWYTIFTRRLNDHIKLVGCTINCEYTPHVQSYLWTLNLETLDFLLKNNTVFTCHESMFGTISKAEIGASQILLDSGYGIDSLMTKYQGVDFRYNRSAKCVDKINPTFNKAANGITLDPYEVVFVKMKGVVAQDLENRERVDIYEKWLHL
jgi:hypothetical protein